MEERKKEEDGGRWGEEGRGDVDRCENGVAPSSCALDGYTLYILYRHPRNGKIK